MQSATDSPTNTPRGLPVTSILLCGLGARSQVSSPPSQDTGSGRHAARESDSTVPNFGDDNSATVTIDSAPSNRFVYFVAKASRYRLKQIDVGAMKPAAFFKSLQDSYRDMKGHLRSFFSIDVFKYCEFVKVTRFIQTNAKCSFKLVYTIASSLLTHGTLGSDHALRILTLRTRIRVLVSPSRRRGVFLPAATDATAPDITAHIRGSPRILLLPPPS